MDQTTTGAPLMPIASTTATGPSFIQKLRETVHSAKASSKEDPWAPTLRKIRGKVGHDGVERVSSSEVFDRLEVPMGARPAQTVRLSRVMRELGWQSIRARGLNPGSYRDRVRGYAREVPGHPATLRLPNKF
jgi:hypothetical protein